MGSQSCSDSPRQGGLWAEGMLSLKEPGLGLVEGGSGQAKRTAGDGFGVENHSDLLETLRLDP